MCKTTKQKCEVLRNQFQAFFSVPDPRYLIHDINAFCGIDPKEKTHLLFPPPPPPLVAAGGDHDLDHDPQLDAEPHLQDRDNRALVPLRSLRVTNDSADVTLVGEDGKQSEVQKVISSELGPLGSPRYATDSTDVILANEDGGQGEVHSGNPGDEDGQAELGDGDLSLPAV